MFLEPAHPYPFLDNTSEYSFFGKNGMISVIVPVKNEQENIKPLLQEIAKSLRGFAPFEIIYIDDGSTDQTSEILHASGEEFHELRFLSHKTSCGQSSSIRTGILSAKGSIIVTLDGDGQNDPADIPRLVTPLLRENAPLRLGMVAGQRRQRIDHASKQWASKVANFIRSRLLRDGVRDTGCGLKAFRKDAYLLLPFFDHQHRYLPALMIREGFSIDLMDVNHRGRQAGRSNYGTLDRLWAGLSDIFGVFWLLQRRKRTVQITEYPLARSSSSPLV
jgi:dolichol-phosphate mannosyltransferase